MSIITLPNIFQTGQVIDAGKENANFQAIVQDYNGNITNANLSSSIAITDSKLNQITTASKVSGTALTGLASIPSGAGIIPAANLTFANISYPYVKCSYTLSSGTSGGSATATTWTTSVLNTKNVDTASIGTLTSNQLTLPAGTYQVKIKLTFYQSGNSQIRLQNITGSATLLGGMSVNCPTSSSTTLACIDDQITLGGSTAIAIQYWAGVHTSSADLGSAAGTGANEVYTVAEFTKLS